MSNEEILERLAQLESLVEEQRATIEEQQATLERLTAQSRDGPERDGPHRDAQVVLDGGNVKVIGEIGADDATGVKGKATGSGSTCGVKGEASNGYGLYTPGEAKVDGVAELAKLGGGVTGDTTITDLTGTGLAIDDGALSDPQLPAYDAIDTTSTSAITTALQEEFHPPRWADTSTRGRYSGVTAGETIPSTNAFAGAALTPDGRVVFAPSRAGEVGVFDPAAGSDGEYTGVTATTSGSIPSSRAFAGAALVPDGRVVFAPYEAGEVGVFDPSAGTDGEYTSVTATTAGSSIPSSLAFSGAALAPDGRVVFAPHNADEVGVFDPSAGTDGEYVTADASGIPSTNQAFYGAALLPDGRVVFAPYSADEVGVFDPSAGSNGEYVTADDSGIPSTNPTFAGAALLPDGRVVFAPYEADEVGVFDPSAGTDGEYTGVSATTVGSQIPSANFKFRGAALLPDGRVVFAPWYADEVGVFDPSAGTDGEYATADASGIPSTNLAFYGAALLPDGRVVFAPNDAGEVGVFEPESGIEPAFHPLVNQ